MILYLSHANWTKVHGLVLAFPSFSDLFRVAYMYPVTIGLSPSFQHCHRARSHLVHHAFARPHLASRYCFKVIHHRHVSILCCTISVREISPLIHRKDRETPHAIVFGNEGRCEGVLSRWTNGIIIPPFVRVALASYNLKVFHPCIVP